MSSSLVSTDLIYASDNAIKGIEVVMTGGTLAGEKGTITAFTASSDTATIDPAFTDNTAEGDTFDLYDPKIADKDMLDLWIKLAIESVIDDYALPWEDEATIVGQSVLRNGGFSEWTNGTSAAPDYWTGGLSDASTLWQNTEVLRRGLYTVACSGIEGEDENIYAGLAQYGTYLAVPFAELLGHSVTFSVWGFTNDVSCLSVSVADGESTDLNNTQDSYGWNYMSASLTISSLADSAQFYAGFLVTGIHTGYWVNPVLLVSGHPVYEYYLPAAFGAVSRLVRDDGESYAFTEEIPARYYDIDFANSRLVFNKQYYTPVYGVHYKLFGEQYPQVPTSDSDTIIVPVDYIIAYCRMMYLKVRQPANTSGIYYASAEVERMKRKLPKRPRANRRMAR